MHSPTLIVMFALFLHAGQVVACHNATDEQIRDQFNKAALAEGSERSETEEMVVFTIQGNDSRIFSYFTKSPHPAHPSNALTAIYESEGALWAYSKAFTAGDCDAFRTLLASVEAQHETLKESFQRAK
jgi:hypothetical protein